MEHSFDQVEGLLPLEEVDIGFCERLCELDQGLALHEDAVLFEDAADHSKDSLIDRFAVGGLEDLGDFGQAGHFTARVSAQGCAGPSKPTEGMDGPAAEHAGDLSLGPQGPSSKRQFPEAICDLCGVCLFEIWDFQGFT